MAKMNYYTIYDLVAQEAGPVFQAKNDEVAYRSYNNILKDLSEASKDDFKLICLLSLDTSTLDIDVDVRDVMDIKIKVPLSKAEADYDNEDSTKFMEGN